MATHTSPRRFSGIARTAWVAAGLLAVGVFLSPPPTSSQANVLMLADAEAPAAAEASANRCSACHSFEAGFSHPVDIRPRAAVPAAFPLENGAVTCLTCHEERAHSSRGPGPMLRGGTTAASMCSQCHTDSDARRSPHTLGVEKAHFPTTRTRSIARQRPTGHLDQESQGCMACHDGSTAKDAGSHAIGGMSMMGESRDHPIAVPYKSSKERGRDVRLVELSRLDRRVRLFNQSVGCGSCHTPYSKNEKLLVMSNRQSQLCLSCHDE